jgi:uncharacterized protein (DUF1499 family)
MYTLVGIACVLIVAGCAWLLFTVDDWSRDLTTNTAATSATAKNPSLRPIESNRPPAELAELISTTAGKIPGWEFVTQEEGRDAIVLHFVRTTRLMRFKDDITVQIRPTAGQSSLTRWEVSAESKSRVGKGDFGQNPRNLAELMDRLRDLLQ